MPQTDAQRRATRKYQDKTTVPIKIKLNLETDADIIAWLAKQDNKQGAMKTLIREDIIRRGAKT